MELIEMRQKLEALALEVSSHLPAEWTLQPPREDRDDNDHKRFCNSLGMCFSIRWDWRTRERIVATAWEWPTYKKLERGEVRSQTIRPRDLWDPKETGSHDITVAYSRGAKALAEEIKRRLLPEYERVWKRCKEKADNYQQHEDKAEAQWQEVCKLLGKDATRKSHYNAIGSLSIDDRNGSLHIEGYISFEDLKKLAALGLQPRS